MKYIEFSTLASVLLGVGQLCAPHLASAAEVSVVTAHREQITDRLTYPGQVRSSVNATFVAEGDAVVRKLHVSLGSAVQSNQRLLTLENADTSLQYEPMIVRAPVTGVISVMDVTIGTRVVKGQQLGAITDPARISIRIEVSGADLKSVRPGLPGTFLPSDKEQTLPVQVLGMSPSLDPTTGTATTEVGIDKAAVSALSIGEVGRVSFEVNPRQAFLVPETAILYRRSETFVGVVTGGKAVWTKVKLGRIRDSGAGEAEKVEIISGIEEGDSVIASSNGYVNDGDAVTVRRP